MTGRPLSLDSAMSPTKEGKRKEGPEALKKTGKEATLASGHQLQPLAAKAVLQSRSQRMFSHLPPGDHGLENASLPKPQFPHEEEARVLL